MRSVIDYALPVYHQNLKQTDIARLENLQYRAAKIESGALHFTNKDKLNLELGWETLMEHGKILGLNIFQKIHLHETRPLIRKCMTILDFEKQRLTRSKGGYIPHTNYGKQFKMSFFPYFSGLWNSLPPNIQCKNIEDFKIYAKEELKPTKFKHFSRGSKIGNSLLTRIRVGTGIVTATKWPMTNSILFFWPVVKCV